MFSERARLNRKKGWSKVIPLQETAWFRDLCADGDIEPNPGPSSSISCAFLNCNGLSRAWEALDEMCSFDTFCLAETQVAPPTTGQPLAKLRLPCCRCSRQTFVQQSQEHGAWRSLGCQQSTHPHVRNRQKYQSADTWNQPFFVLMKLFKKAGLRAVLIRKNVLTMCVQNLLWDCLNMLGATRNGLPTSDISRLSNIDGSS